MSEYLSKEGLLPLLLGLQAPAVEEPAAAPSPPLPGAPRWPQREITGTSGAEGLCLRTMVCRLLGRCWEKPHTKRSH